jgi:hypothetical protein
LNSLILVTQVYDDNIFYYFCYDDGNLIDGYDSSGGILDITGISDDPVISLKEKILLKGNPQSWINKLPYEVDVTKIKNTLTAMSNSDMFLGNNPDIFCQLLCIPNAMTSFDYLKNGDEEMLNDINQLNNFIHVKIDGESMFTSFENS